MRSALLQSDLVCTLDPTRNVIDSLTEYAVIAQDREGNIVLWNEGARRVYGYRSEEVVGQHAALLFAWEDARVDVLQKVTRAALQYGKWEGTLSQVRKSGDRFVARLTLTPRHGRGGQHIGVALIVRDISNEVALASKLEENQFYTRSLIEANVDAAMAVDLEGRITDVNGHARELLGCATEELVGAPFRGFFTDPLRADEVLQRVLEAGKLADYELTARAKSGPETVVSCNATTLCDREGRVQGVLIAARDLTAHMRDAKDRFFATMSHELRTPLNAILGFTGTLLMKLPGPLTDDQESQLKTIRSSGRHLLTLIDDLLDLAKVETGKIDLHLEPVVCQEVIEEVVTALGPVARDKGLGLEVEAPEPDVVISSDRRVLRHILINLASNAIKFTHAGTVRIVVAPPEGPAGTTEIRVTDTGIGLRPEDMERLFQPFARIRAKGSVAGSGLGLHVSQKLAGLLGGSITAASEVGRGSVFTLVLR